jgi:ABC-type uncharacterized transport system permease subunit
MDPITLLALGALVCALAVIFFSFIAIKFRNEEWAFIVVIGIFICGGGAAWCLQEAVKRADARTVPANAR